MIDVLAVSSTHPPLASKPPFTMTFVQPPVVCGPGVGCLPFDGVGLGVRAGGVGLFWGPVPPTLKPTVCQALLTALTSVAPNKSCAARIVACAAAWKSASGV